MRMKIVNKKIILRIQVVLLYKVRLSKILYKKFILPFLQLFKKKQAKMIDSQVKKYKFLVKKFKILRKQH